MSNQTSVRREYTIGALACASIYVALTLGAKVAIREIEPHGALLIAMAIAPALAIIAFFFVFARYLARVDEYQRSRIVRALLIAIAGTLSASAIWDFLQAYGNVAPPEPFIFTCGFILLFGMAQGFLKVFERLRGAA